jgi:hypothetical protein
MTMREVALAEQFVAADLQGEAAFDDPTPGT